MTGFPFDKDDDNPMTTIVQRQCPSCGVELPTDAPASGELWRLNYGSGESSANAMYMGVDDAQQPWIRVGTDLIKPLANTEYRMARGPTVLP